MMRTTLKRAALVLALVLPSMTAMAEPPAGVLVAINRPAVMVCDTKDQIADIAHAAIEGGVEAALAVFRPYFEGTNDRGERSCVLAPIRGQVALGESIYIGIGEVKGAKREFWAVNFMGRSGIAYWMLWDEAVVKPEPTGSYV